MEAIEEIYVQFCVFYVTRFVQYTATLGGDGNKPGCFRPYDVEHNVILQYSTDGGIHWHTLHTLDYTGYRDPLPDYIRLPQEARTPSTRIRWWQPLPLDPFKPPPAWALDNVYIGNYSIFIFVVKHSHQSQVSE